MDREMSARELLEQVREADGEIDILRESVWSTWARLTSTTAAMDGVVVQHSADPHALDAVGDLDSAVYARIAELSAMKARAVRLISGLESPAQRRVLLSYYVNGVDARGRRKTWEGVAYELGYSLRRVQQLQTEGLAAVEKLRGIA
jgi:DNA-directed RNA polymerase sigma subunit (sigma70/sigma32)